MTTVFLFVILFVFLLHRPADRDVARAVLDADDPALRARQHGLAVAQVLPDHGAVHAARHPVLHPGRQLPHHRRRRQAHDQFRRSPPSAICRAGSRSPRVLACMLFAAVSGSSPATVVAIGSIVIAGMVARRLYAGLRHRRDRQRRHARHSDPALDRHGGLCRGDRNLGRPPVHGRRHPRHPARPDADGGDLCRRARS